MVLQTHSGELKLSPIIQFIKIYSHAFRRTCWLAKRRQIYPF
jgi:hypothetical protein